MNYKYDVYVCYSQKNWEKVKKICGLLDAAGISYFIERCDILADDKLDIVPEIILRSNLFLLIGSENTVVSSDARKEFLFAIKYKDANQVLPLLIDDNLQTAQLAMVMGNFRFRRIDRKTSCVDFVYFVKNKVRKPRVLGCPPRPITHETSECVAPYNSLSKISKTYQAKYESKQYSGNVSKGSFWSKIFGKKEKQVTEYEVYSSVFASAELRRKSHLLVQVYLHLFEETEEVKAMAQESDKNAERRDYIPLQCKLKKGDKVDVLLNIYGETLLTSDKKSVVWQGSFTKCSFDYFVPKDIDVDELSCVAILTVNGVPVGEMRFITKIVDAPRQLNPEIIAHKYSKVFISYSHQDESKVKFLHEGLELGAVPHFFDRKYLKAGDVFPQVIQDYINSADLFILCWSENASKSEYVQKERFQALERAFPQVKPEQEAKLRIYPMSIEPRAELPTDMKENYHFGEI